MDKSVSQLIEEKISNLEVNYEAIEEAKQNYFRTLTLQKNKIIELADKLKPILSYIQETNGTFYNSRLDIRSDDGPVLAATDNKMYVYDFNLKLINEYRITDYQLLSKNIRWNYLLSLFSCKQIYYDLLQLVYYQENLIKKYDGLINKANESLSEI
ncbi:hypothetical protein [Bacillus velezensis]|uniref:hypothetical protein n=1 Tax=Bacillus velezensis TaxID=492670 RepID=UPI003F6E3AE8